MEKNGSAFNKPMLKCGTCGRVLSSAYKLREHVMIHTGQKPHACSTCSQAFRTKPDLARHMRIHTGVRPYACKLCGQRFYRSDNLKGHMKTHKDMEVLACFRCGKGFKTLDQLNVHYKASHDKEDKAESLVRDPKKSEELEKDSPDVSFEEKETEPVMLKGPSNEKPQALPVLLSAVQSDVNIKRSPSVDSGRNSSHIIWCDDCGQGFHQKGALALHIKVAHPTKKPILDAQPEIRVESILSDTAYICPTCGQVFTKLEILKDHISGTHQENGEGDDMIADENMNIRRVSDLPLDLASPSGEAVISIDSEESEDELETEQHVDNNEKSNMSSADESLNYSNMMMLDIGDDDIELIHCDTCKKVFPTKQDLYRHEVSDHGGAMPYKCTSCGRGFARKDRLVNHMRLHTGKSPHHCEFCGKTFTAASSLKEHLKIHSGMKPHRCHVCHKDFRQKCVLTRHMRNVHKVPSQANVDANSNDIAKPVASELINNNNVAKAVVEHAPTLTKVISTNHTNKPVIKNKVLVKRPGVTISTPRVILPKPGVSLLTGLVVPNIQIAQSDSPVVLVSISKNNSTAVVSNPPVLVKSATIKCPLCSIICSSEATLNQHIKLSHPGFKLVCQTEHKSALGSVSISAFRCVSCDMEFSSQALLLEHCDLVHPALADKAKSPFKSRPIQKESAPAIKDESSSDISYKCFKCSAKFPLKSELLEHFTLIHPSQKSSSDGERQEETSSNESIASPEHSAGPGSGSDSESSPLGMSLRTIPQPEVIYTSGHKYRCALCHEGFKSSEVLSDHMDQHLRSNPFFCNYCGQTFRNTNELETHLDVHRTARDPHFLALESIGIKKDGEEDPMLKEPIVIGDFQDDINAGGLYGCNFCFKAFSKVRSLVLHLKNHITDKPHLCILCGKSFSQSVYLKQHVMTHTGQRPHVCNICGRGFVQKTQMVLHMRKHTGYTPFKCDHCNKAFTNKSVLKLHLQKHLPERPYSCSVCGRGFTQAGNMRRHAMMVHRHLNLDQIQAIMSPVNTSNNNEEEEYSKPLDAPPAKKKRKRNKPEGGKVLTLTEKESTADTSDVDDCPPLDLSVQCSEPMDDDEPSDDLMVMGAYYSSQRVETSTSSKLVPTSNTTEISEASNENQEDDEVQEENDASSREDAEGIFQLKEFKIHHNCEACLDGFSEVRLLKEHLGDAHFPLHS